MHIKQCQEGDTSAGTYRRNKISVKEIACELYGYELNQSIDRRFSLDISRTLTALGWNNTGNREYLDIYGRQRMFYLY
ncbi:MAG: hypothetical protein NC244_13715 [Alistipes senegalensis]|nr:hypothetical protein [Alistipes senegalensis]